MIYLTLVVFLMFGHPTYANSEIVKIFQTCIPSHGIGQQVKHEMELRRDLQRPDLRMKLVTGYSNNEISQANPERMQYGVNLRWEDLVDSSGRQELHEQKGQLLTQQSKIALESYWRMKLKDFYFIKWGQPLISYARSVQTYAEQKLTAGNGNLGSLATSRSYSDLLNLNQVASDFVAKYEALEKEFSKCKSLSAWKPKLDFSVADIRDSANKKSYRLSYQEHSCQNQKKIKTIYNHQEAGNWTVALNTSFIRNRLLRDENSQFNDIRAGLELNIPITGINANDVVVDVCDYDTRTLQSEDMAEKNLTVAMYPILSSLEKQFQELSKRARILIEETPKFSAPVQDVVLMSLNIFQLHRSLSEGESKMNSRIVPAKIVEDAL